MSSSRDYLVGRMMHLLDTISDEDLTDHEIADMIRLLENPETRLRTSSAQLRTSPSLRVVVQEAD